MESTRKLRAFILMTLIFVSVFIFNWYSKIDKVRLIIENEDRTLSLKELDDKYTGYDETKTYFYRKKIKKTEQNSLIPFVYKTKILSESKYSLHYK